MAEAKLSPSDFEAAVLQLIDRGPLPLDSRAIAKSLGASPKAVRSLIQSLSASAYVTTQDASEPVWVLTDEGKLVADSHSPEFLLYQALPADGSISMKDFTAKHGKAITVGMGPARKNKWIKTERGQLSRAVDPSEVKDQTQQDLVQIAQNKPLSDPKDYKLYKGRKLIDSIADAFQLIEKRPTIFNKPPHRRR
eukprot:GABV01000436.1.p1 GENE.GABV01000436.1~~GABV01000436.1.p1  ORF type:complete len:194 (+),score=77.01 GABV01000436.1:2-583(+)